MSGIVGIYNFQTITQDPAKTILRRMLSRMKHRGPDQSGIYLSDFIGLGTVQLNTLGANNISVPITNADGSLWLVGDGEIFNHVDLRRELESQGQLFKTDEPKEVILHLYEKYGPEFINRLNGQFAFAIWDKYKEELFLVRDRIGIRPLYYTEVGEAFVFTSEVKSLLEFPDFQTQLSAKSISEYFTFWTFLPPNTAFENVFEVPPGHYIIINKGGKNTNKYWELPLYKPSTYKYTDVEDAAKEFETIFSDAVKIRLQADVEVAAYLSGGLDSSVTTSFIKTVSPNNLRTFSIAFEDQEYDESAYQLLAANYFKTSHSNFVCSSNHIADTFKDVIWHSETPLLRTSPAPMNLLAKHVRNHNVKVIITGEGADELLGGYNIFKEAKVRRFWAKDVNSKYRPLLLKKLYPYLSQMKNMNSNVLKMFFGYKLLETQSSVYSHLLRWNNTSRINNYLAKEYREAIGDYNPIATIEENLDKKLKGLDSLTKAQWIEINLFMSGYLLSSQGDRMAMANSVEGRYPFLDHRVIEFCMSLHPDLKLKGLNEKYLLKQVMKDRMPDEILNRSKQPYRAPIRSVFVTGDLPIYLKEMLSEAAILQAGIFNHKHVEQLLNKLNSKTQVSEIDNMAITAILSTQILHDLFINRSLPKLTDDTLITLDNIITDYKN